MTEEPKLTGQLAVGAVIFNVGIKLSTVQGCIDRQRAYYKETEAKLRAALSKIERWELPPSGEFYPNEDGSISDRPAPYDSFYAYGTKGGQEAIRRIAREALEN